MRRTLSTSLLLALLMMVGFVDAAEPAKPVVVTSFTIIADWVQVLGGKQFEQSNIVPSRSETHGYQLNARNARDLQRASLIVGMCPTLEPWLEAWAKAHDRADRLIWLFDDRAGDHQGLAQATDPHAWTSPAEVKKMTRRLADRLKAIGSSDATEDSYFKYVEEVDRVDQELRRLFAGLPADRRNLVTQHANMEHFAKSYGLRIAGTILAGSSAESADMSTRRFSELLALIRREGIRLIVTDAGQNDVFARRLAEDAGLPPPLALSIECLEPDGQPGDRWTSMMLLNGRRLHEALSTR